MRDRWVLLRRTDDYTPEKLDAVVREAFDLFGPVPRGRTLIKPNVVFANRDYARHPYTRPELVGAVVDQLRARKIDDIFIGESGGYGMPTGMMFAEAGYTAMARDRSVPLVDFNEEPTVRRTLHRARFHTTFDCPRLIDEADFKIWMPKLKYHNCCQITQALKLNIGSLLHHERMLFHDERLDDKIVDLLEVCRPDLVISDAVIIGHGYECCPLPFPLGIVLVSNDPLAADIVGAQLLGYRPEQVRHLRKAAERGYGDIDPESVRILGDADITELTRRTAHIVCEFQDIQQIETPIRFYEGPAPHLGTVCYGGCSAAVKGSLGIIHGRRPGSLSRARPGAVVMGAWSGDVDAGDGVCLLLGDCTGVSGNIRARRVLRLGGCPPGTLKISTLIPLIFGLPHPMLSLRDDARMVFHTLLRAWRQLRNEFRYRNHLRGS